MTESFVENKDLTRRSIDNAPAVLSLIIRPVESFCTHINLGIGNAKIPRSGNAVRFPSAI